MTFLPIVQRELQSRSRRAATHWSRWGIAVAGALICFQIFTFEMNRGRGMNVGQITFASLTVMAFFLAASAVLRTADAISFERREGTLGLLFLTNLKGYDVIFGKLVATGLAGFYAMLGFAPALAFPLVAGGVTGGELIRTTLAVMNMLWIALAVGLWVSIGSELQYRAIRQAVLILLALMVGPWLLHAVLPKFSSGTSFHIAMASPHFPFYAGSAARYPWDPGAFWWSLGIAHLEGWLFLAAASRSLGNGWRDDAKLSSSTEVKRPSRRRTWTSTTSPILHSASQLRGQTAIFWFAILLKMSGWIWMRAFYARLGPSPFTVSNSWLYGYYGINLVSSFGSAIMLAWAGARYFLHARRAGELELLVSTPVGAREIVSGQWTALWRGLRWPLSIFILLNVLQILPGLISHYRPSIPIFYLMGQNLFSLANTVLGIIAICRVAIWFGLRSRNAFLAIAWTAGLVQGTPWVLGVLVNMVLSFGGARSVVGGGLPLSVVPFYLMVPLLTLAANIFFIRWANRNLRRELRLTPAFKRVP